MNAPQVIYPGQSRQKVGYSIRFIKSLLASDAVREIGADAVLLAIFIASREDKLHYKKAPAFWRGELMDRFGIKSPKDFIRIRDRAVDAGLLHHEKGTRFTPGLYWSLVPKWMENRMRAVPKTERKEQPEPFPKRNGKSSSRSQNGTEVGTDEGTEVGTLSIPYTHIPIERGDLPPAGARKFIPPRVEEIGAYLQELGCQSSVKAQSIFDHYESNGWRVGKSPMKSWKAAVRRWVSREGEFGNSSKVEPKPAIEYPNFTGKGKRA
jgi:hypothetical protein